MQLKRRRQDEALQLIRRLRAISMCTSKAAHRLLRLSVSQSSSTVFIYIDRFEAIPPEAKLDLNAAQRRTTRACSVLQIASCCPIRKREVIGIYNDESRSTCGGQCRGRANTLLFNSQYRVVFAITQFPASMGSGIGFSAPLHRHPFQRACQRLPTSYSS